jgi:hypothetical protein
MPADPSPGPVVVLGMHRSGTSYVASLLHGSGYSMGGALLEAAQSNPAGHFEDRNVVRFHDRALATRGLKWYSRDIPAPLAFSTKERSWVARYVTTRSRSGDRWGFKDPRSALFWPSWQELLPPSTAQCLVFRNPLSVATSLFLRDGIPTTRGLALWCLYNSVLLESVESSPYPVYYLDFDSPAHIPRILSAVTGKTLSDNFRPDLQHHSEGAIAHLDQRTIAIYDELRHRYSDYIYNQPPSSYEITHD